MQLWTFDEQVDGHFQDLNLCGIFTGYCCDIVVFRCTANCGGNQFDVEICVTTNVVNSLLVIIVLLNRLLELHFLFIVQKFAVVVLLVSGSRHIFEKWRAIWQFLIFIVVEGTLIYDCYSISNQSYGN